MPTVRTVVRSLIIGVLALPGVVAGPVSAASAAPATPAAATATTAAASQAQQASDAQLTSQAQLTSSAQQASQAQPGEAAAAGASAAAASLSSVSIVSVSPQFAQPGKTIEVKGTITNHTGGSLSGVRVELLTSLAGFSSRSVMEDFAAGHEDGLAGSVIGAPGATWTMPPGKQLASGATTTWSASFPARAAGYQQFGVYPLLAQAMTAGFAALGSDRTLLPYWPGSGAAAPKQVDVSWIMPLIDTPQEGACRRTLSTDELASSLAPGGRLETLLAAGKAYGTAADLTWAVDPALLADADTMTQRYKVDSQPGGNAACTDTTVHPASSPAASWLAQLRAAAGSEPLFVTPYADPDVSAMSHSGLDAQLSQAYLLGDAEAAKVLGITSPEEGIAWPPGGTADNGTLTSLARDGRVTATVLASAEMPPQQGYAPDDAVTSVTTGISTSMTVLLADSEITGLLGEASPRDSAASQFDLGQDFLAETAMIVAEAPYSATARSVVIAPPSGWDPSAAEAAQLLSASSSAPWLKPVALGDLAKTPPSQVSRQKPPAYQRAPLELSASYMRQVKSASASASLLQSLLYKPADSDLLPQAVLAAESAAWDGRAGKAGLTRLRVLQSYLRDNVNQVRIISGNKVLLAGNSGSFPVSVSNGLPYAIQVKVVATPSSRSSLSVDANVPATVVAPGQTAVVRVKVHSAALGSTQVQLRLATSTGQLVPGAASSITLESTRYGRALLVLIGGALGVLVLASVVRWARRIMRGPGETGDPRGEAGGPAGGTGVDGAPDDDDAPEEDGSAGTGATLDSAGGDASLRAAGRSGGTG